MSPKHTGWTPEELEALLEVASREAATKQERRPRVHGAGPESAVSRDAAFEASIAWGYEG